MNTNRFYVYLHRRKSDDVVFYVGKGVKHRINTKASRSKRWKEVADSFGFYSEILYSDLDNESALKIEEDLISNPRCEWQLINKVKHQKILKIDTSLLSKYEYDETSPSFLRYKVNTKKTKTGDVAGYFDAYGYYRVNHKGQHYKVHRLIYKIFNIDVNIDDLVINHIDGDTTNNSISNLEAVTKAENNNKTKIQRGHLRPDNKTGVTNVTLSDSGHGHLYYRVFYKDIDGVIKSKNFSCNKFGKELAFSLATDFMNGIKA